MKRIDYKEATPLALERIARGQAVVTANGEKPNTMTIGWGSVGVCWGKPIFTVYVRPQRFTHDMIQKTREFTISVGLTDDLAELFRFAGSTSGRDLDKFSGHGLTAEPAQKVSAPIVKECQLHFECRVLEETRFFGETMDDAVHSRQYPEDDFHTVYMGEIVDCYRTDL